MLSDEEELEKIHKTELNLERSIENIRIVPFNDEDKLKFHKYVKNLAQSLLGDEVDLDKENLVFLLSDSEKIGAAFCASENVDETFIYVSAGLIKLCQNKDQLAFVLGHELQHFLEYKKHGIHYNSKSEEEYADLSAIPKMAQAGLNIEEAVAFSDEIFKNKDIIFRNLLDEHVSDPNRRTLLGMQITYERDRIKKQGKGSDDVTGKKTHPIDDDLLSLVNNCPKFQEKNETKPPNSLETFFASDEYCKASYRQKVDMWFNKVEEALRKDIHENGDISYRWSSDEDMYVLSEKRYELKRIYMKTFNSKRKYGKSDKDQSDKYYFDERLLDFMLNETSLYSSNSKFTAMNYLISYDHEHLNSDYACQYLRQKYNNLSSMTDEEQIQLMANNINNLSRCGYHLRHLSGNDMLGLSNSQKDVGKNFSKEILYTQAYLSSEYCLDQIFDVKRFYGENIIIKDKAYFLLGKEGKIELIGQDYEKIIGKVLADYINEDMRILKDIREGKEVDAQLKYRILSTAWNLTGKNFIKRESGIGEKIISTEMITGKKNYIKFAYVEKYLDPEVKSLLKSMRSTKKRSKYSNALAGLWIKNVHEFNTIWPHFNPVADFLSDQLNKGDDRIDAIEKVTKVFSERVTDLVMQVSSLRLWQHLKAGRNLDDFEFPFEEELKTHNNRMDFMWMAYYNFEMLKKNPQIDLSLLNTFHIGTIHKIRSFKNDLCNCFDKKEKQQKAKRLTHKAFLYVEDKFLDNMRWYRKRQRGTSNHQSKYKELITQRIQDNIDNQKNWGNGLIEEGMYDAPFMERFLLILDKKSGMEELKKIALHFYKEASIDDKLNDFTHYLGVYIHGFYDKQEKSELKEKVCQILKKDFSDKSIPLKKRFDLLLEVNKANLFDDDKVHYFETLVGKDGKGGFLKEIEDMPGNKFEFYIKLMDDKNRIPDPEIRAKVISLAVKQFHKENGFYDDITASDDERQSFIDCIKNLKKNELSNVPETDKNQFLRELAEITLAQGPLSFEIKPDHPKINVQDGKVIGALYGLDTLTYLMQKGTIPQDTVINYLLSDGSENEIDKVLNIYRNKLKENKYFSRDGDILTPQNLRRVKKEFDAAPLEGKAAIINLIMSDYDWEEQFNVVAQKLFKDAGELGEVGKKFLRSYIASRPGSERCYYLSAMYVAANNNVTRFDDKNSPYTIEQRSLAQGLRLFLENSGSAGIKLAQAMSSYNGVPDYIRDEMQKAKNNANPPARWEVFEWLNNAKEKLNGKLGKLLGSASFFATYELKGDDGIDKVVKILRCGSKDIADAEFKIYKEMLKKMKKEFPWIESFSRLVENAASMVDVETNLDIGEQQLRDAQKLYPDKTKVGNIEFNMKVMDWGEHGKTWAEMEKAEGKDFKDLEQPYKTEVAKAIFTTELANMLSGKRFDSDRHSGQYKIDEKTNTIGIFDTGSMSVIEPTEKEKIVLGRVIAETVKKLGNSDENVGAVLCSEIDKGIEKYYKEEIAKGEAIPPYLSEFQRGLLALTDFHKEIPAKELGICVMQALNNEKHKLDPAIYQGFVSSMVEKDGKRLDVSFKKKLEIGSSVLQLALAPEGDEIMTKEARLAQVSGRLVMDQIIKGQDLYGVLVNLSGQMKSEEVMNVLNTSYGQLHFAKGMTKQMFQLINPSQYSSEEKQQVGVLLYRVIEKGTRQKKLNQEVSLSQIFEEMAHKEPKLGEYAKNLLKISQMAEKVGMDSDIEMFRKAVILGRIVDYDVQRGYMKALQESPQNSFIKKALSRVDPVSFVPQKHVRKMIKFVTKKMAPKCIKMINNLEKMTKNEEKARA